MAGWKAAAVVMVVVGLFTFPTHAGITYARTKRQLPQTNTVNSGQGASTCPEFCPFDYTPVCGNDGVTYTNPCSLSLVACSEKPTLTAAYMGTCDPTILRPSPTPTDTTLPGGPTGGAGGGTCQEECPQVFAPVCGTDGVTYSSECQLQFASCLTGAGLTVATEGPCEAASPTPSDATTQEEPSVLQEVDPVIPPTISPACPQQCARIFFPVCGSDGKTYENQCRLEQSDCESRAAGGPSIIVMAEGSCEAPSEAAPPPPVPEDPKCVQKCTRIFFPVCGSDGKTYNSVCLLEIADCESRASGGASIVVTSEGPCGQSVQDNVVAADTPPTVSTCSKECTRIFLPVCGSNGATYNNMCLMEIADCESKATGGRGITLLSEGACGSATPQETPVQTPPQTTSCLKQCTRIFLPVCGSDSKTYNNLCLMEIADCESKAAGGAGITLISERACEAASPQDTSVQAAPQPTSCSKQCTRIFLPVCGSDRKTYNSLCLMEIADCENRVAGGPGITLVSEGACESVSRPEIPVQAAPPQPTSCSRQCTRIFLPVCGSDGKTYNSLCLMEIADCENRAAGGPGITLTSEGTCEIASRVSTVTTTPAPSSCPQECVRIFLPVCGSDGKTYNNPCLMEVADCESKAAGRDGVSLVSEGTCETATSPEPPVQTVPTAPSCSKQCTRIFLPVCGSNGKTYNSLCLMEIADCEDRAAGGAGVSLASEGACGPAEPPVDTSRTDPVGAIRCRRQCPRSSVPVCGSDGVTYDNECLMEESSCRARREGGRHVYLKYGGPCDPMFDDLGSGCRKCTDEFEPVCGSDGVTYTNECVLDASNCGRWARKEQGIYLVDEGPCGGVETRPSSELETSPNIVLASSLTASPPQSQPRPLSASPLLNSAAQPCPEACTKEFRPVCGSNGETYNNPCALEVANCRSRARGGVAVVQEFAGPCVAALPQGPDCGRPCNKAYLPVCGSDGETYGNQCLLEFADCLNPFVSITKAGDGPCSSGGGVGGGSLLPVLPPTSSSEEDDDDSAEVTSFERSADSRFLRPF